jgi:hypothetical protein
MLAGEALLLPCLRIYMPDIVANHNPDFYLVDGDLLFDAREETLTVSTDASITAFKEGWDEGLQIPEEVERHIERELSMTAAAEIAQQGPGEFVVTLIDETNPTVDGRIFEPGKVTWREPPLPLMYLTENRGDGHKGSIVGGVITDIWREGDKVLGKGRFDSGENGQELRRLIGEQILAGVSSDVGGAIVEQELADDGTAQSRIMQGRIMGATVLPFPAFDETRIENSDDEEESLVAAAVPAAAPATWFNNPELKGPSALTITDEGRIFGHAATWDTCHIGHQNRCLTPPKSRHDYAYFRTGEVITAEGDHIPTGTITLGTGHAGLTLSSRATAEHYDHTGTGVGDVVTGEDEFGLWVAGAIRPGITETRLQELRASALSGDWRTVGGALELVALLAVNVPGFPIPRTKVTFSAEESPLALVAAGVITQEVLVHETEKQSDDEEESTNEDASETPDDEKTEDLTKPEELSDEEREELTERVQVLEGAIVALAASHGLVEFGHFSGTQKGKLEGKGGGPGGLTAKQKAKMSKKKEDTAAEDAEELNLEEGYGTGVKPMMKKKKKKKDEDVEELVAENTEEFIYADA